MKKLVMIGAAVVALVTVSLAPTASSAHGWGHGWSHGYGDYEFYPFYEDYGYDDYFHFRHHRRHFD